MDWHSLKIGVLKLETPHVRYERMKKYLKGNIFTGLRIILHEIKTKYGLAHSICTVTDIDKYDIVLISLMSYNDVFNLVYTFDKHKVSKWSCKIIIGGSAVVNIKSYLHYGDYFCFGRSEKSIHDIFSNIYQNKPITNNHIFIRNRSSFNKIYQFRTTEQFYVAKSAGIAETSYGCHKNCYFCQYANTAKLFKCFYGKKAFYKFGHESNFDNLQITDGARYTTAIDGSSQHIRYCFNKYISDSDIIRLFTETPVIDKFITLKIYNICGYPTENETDYEALINLFRRIDTLIKHNTFHVSMYFTPFTPEPVTPAESLEADVFTNYRDVFNSIEKDTDKFIIDGRKIKFYIPSLIPSNYTLFKRMIINRSSQDDIEIIRFILFDKYQDHHDRTHKEKFEHLLSKFDLTKFYKRYSPGNRGEFGYLIGHKPVSKLLNESHELQRNLFAS